MSARVDLFFNTYANFADQVLAAVRAETYGQDIGQTGWVTVDEYESYIGALCIDDHSSVLEVASGSGGPALWLSGRSGCHVIGIDVNPEGVTTANRRAARTGLAQHAAFEVVDATRPLSFGDETFDALLCIDSMNHLPARGDSLREWHRVLRPGGRAVFTDPVVITGPVTNEELAQRSSIGTFVFVPRGMNEELIVKAGFRIVSQTDSTENAALVSRRWREARQRFRDDLLRIEGEERFEGVQKFLGAVHKLTSERRLSRITWVVERPPD
jgi:SAM-dependent methyltransferase